MELSKDNAVTLVVNRDENKAATGFVYFDDGLSINQPQGHFQIQLSANSIKNWVIQSDDSEFTFNRSYVEKIVITDAEDLNRTNFACFNTRESISPNQTTQMRADYDPILKTLTLQGYNTINLHELSHIYFGNWTDEGNFYPMCNQEMQYFVAT